MTLDIAGDVPGRMFGDAQRLRQILLNLAGNGLKFTANGSVRIELRKVRDEQDGIRLSFSVIDTGIGISAEAQGRLFNEFTQGDSSIRRRFGGSGLGLAISRRLVEMMDGQISIESMPGVGSTFRFDVRLRHAPDAVAVAEPERPAAVEPDPELPGDAARQSVLLAEDNNTNRFVATRMLERLGYEVVSVTDGRAAVEAVRERRFDIILMDMMMPEMDGLTATRMIRALPAGQAGVPVIGLTANASPADEDACRQAGMDGFVTKPVKSAHLDAAMREAIGRRRTSAP